MIHLGPEIATLPEKALPGDGQRADAGATALIESPDL